MSKDTMREYGAMAFASRLKRLGDRLKAEATSLYRANGIEFNDSWFLVAFLLSKRKESPLPKSPTHSASLTPR